MAISRKKDAEAEAEAKKYDYDIEVTRAKECVNGNISFDMIVNGVSIFGCFHKELQRKDGSGTFSKIDFPSRKDDQGKYHNVAFFYIDADTMSKIEKAIEAKLNQ